MHKEDAIQLTAMLDEQETPFAHFGGASRA